MSAIINSNIYLFIGGSKNGKALPVNSDNEKVTINQSLDGGKQEVYTRTSFKHLDKVVTVFILDSEKVSYVNMLQRLINDVIHGNGVSLTYSDIFYTGDDNKEWIWSGQMMLCIIGC